MSVLIGLVVLIVAAVIEHMPKTLRGRFAAAAVTSGTFVLVFVFLCAWAWGRRGGRPGSALFAIGMFTLYVLYRLVFEDTVGELLAPDDGALAGRPNPHEPTVSRTVALLVLGGVAVVGWSVPLRFGGALVNDAAGTAVAEVVSFGQFGPLGVKREVAAGQCVESRLVERENVVVPCGYAHRAEIVGEVVPPEPCPEPDASAYDAGRMRVVPTDPMSGVVFCVLQADNPRLRWRRIPDRALADTR